MKVEEAACKSLEIEKITSLIAKRCRSELGVMRASDTEPARDLAALMRRQELFNAIESYREKKGELPWINEVAPIAGYLREAEETGLLTGSELLRIRNVLLLAARIKEKLSAEKAGYPAFSMLIHEIADFTEEIKATAVISDDGRLYDHASEKLRSIRDVLRGLGETIRRKCGAMLNDPHIAVMLQERVLALRNGRYAFLVRQDAMGSFPGIVVDRSSSGSSVYMEPHSLLLLNNRHASERGEERLEESRILRGITALLVSRASAVRSAENAIGTVDLFYALSEMKRLNRWRIPELSKRPLFDIKGARHPMLLERAVPIDIRCGDGFRALVVTGPNTGGKTVALKTAGVCIILAWMGFPIPVKEGTVIGDIGELFADIGDEQSIEQSLSTFSAHVIHIREILENVTERSVVLLDELGAGTDPEEGAALGIAVLDWLREKRTLVLATTHHNPIKRFALQTPGVETAGVEFDIDTLSPTYRILIGIPGRSNALLIAGKLGMPKEIIERATKVMAGNELSMEDLIAQLHEKRAALEREGHELSIVRQKVESLRRDFEEKNKELEEKRDLLIANAEKKALSVIRSAEESARALIKNMESAEAESQARRELEKKREHFARIKEAATRREEKKTARESIAAAGSELKAGDNVQIIGTNGAASVIEVRGKKAIVQAGVAEVEVPLSKLRLMKGAAAQDPLKQVQISVSKPVGVPSSIMVRGMTIDEAIPMVERYLDQAYRAGYGTVTVIHGRGEGILRREVQALCRRTAYVAEHNLGSAEEGGYGVTVVRFRR